MVTTQFNFYKFVLGDGPTVQISNYYQLLLWGVWMKMTSESFVTKEWKFNSIRLELPIWDSSTEAKLLLKYLLVLFTILYEKWLPGLVYLTKYK